MGLMEISLIFQGLILIGIVVLLIIFILIFQNLNKLKEKVVIIDKEIENKILKNVVVDLGKTKEDLITYLTQLRGFYS